MRAGAREAELTPTPADQQGVPDAGSSVAATRRGFGLKSISFLKFQSCPSRCTLLAHGVAHAGTAVGAAQWLSVCGLVDGGHDGSDFRNPMRTEGTY